MSRDWDPAKFNWRRVLSIDLRLRPWWSVAFAFAVGNRVGLLWLGNLLESLLFLVFAIEVGGLIVGRVRRERKRLASYRKQSGRPA